MKAPPPATSHFLSRRPDAKKSTHSRELGFRTEEHGVSQEEVTYPLAGSGFVQAVPATGRPGKRPGAGGAGGAGDPETGLRRSHSGARSAHKERAKLRTWEGLVTPR